MLPDVLEPGLRVVFCGTAASTRSAELGHYYAGPGNRFWPVLHAVGLTPRLLAPAEFRELPAYGLGLTDLVKGKAGMDRVLEPADFDPEGLRSRIARYRPSVLAFTSKSAGRAFLGLQALNYGFHSRLLETALWILPSPSGAARGFWDEGVWRALATEVAPRVS